jgi:hypothetical protein
LKSRRCCLIELQNNHKNAGQNVSQKFLALVPKTHALVVPAKAEIYVNKFVSCGKLVSCHSCEGRNPWWLSRSAKIVGGSSTPLSFLRKKHETHSLVIPAKGGARVSGNLFPACGTAKRALQGGIHGGLVAVPRVLGVARRLLTFFVLPKKVSKKRRANIASPSGSPCKTRMGGGEKTCPPRGIKNISSAGFEQLSPQKIPPILRLARWR